MRLTRARLMLAGIVTAIFGWAFWEVAAPGQVLIYRDHTAVFHPELRQVVEAYRALELPLWDPYTLGGKPLAAYPSSLAYSPFLLVFLLPGEFLTLYDWFVLLHFPAAALAAYFLARTLRLHPAAAALAGVGYGLGGPLIALNSLLPNLESATFGPAALALAIRALRDRSLSATAGLALAMSLHVYSSDPAALFDSAALFALLAPLAMRGAPIGTWWRGGALLGLGTALAALIAAVQVLPLLALLEGTPRGAGYGTEAATFFAAPVPRLLELILPNLAGDYSTGRTLFGLASDGRVYLSSIYVGALCLPLMAVAAGRPLGAVLAAGAVFFSLLSTGAATPLFELVRTVVPPLQYSRFAIKHMYGAGLCFALLAGQGLHALLTSPPERRALLGKRALAVTTPLILVAILLGGSEGRWLAPHLAPGVALDDGLGFLRRASSHALLVSVLGAGLWLLVVKGSISPRAIALASVALFGLDLALAARPSLVTAERDLYRTPPVAKAFEGLPRPVSVFLYDHHTNPPAIPAPSHAEMLAYQHDRLHWSAGLPLGVRYFFGFEANDILGAAWTELSEQFKRLEEPQRVALMGRFGVTHLLVEADVDRAPGLVAIGRAPTRGGPPITVFALESSRGPAYVARRAGPVPGGALSARLLAENDLSTALLAEDDWRGLPSELRLALETATATIGEDVRAEVLELGPNRVLAAARSPAPALLIVTQRYAPGWEAEVNGRAAAVLRVDGHLTAVPIDAGDSRVELRYRPRAFRRGARLSAFGLLATALLGLWAIRARHMSAEVG